MATAFIRPPRVGIVILNTLGRASAGARDSARQK